MVGKFYVAVVQEVLLFGSKTWLLTPRLEKSLEGLHHWPVRQMAVMSPNHQRDLTWLYTPIGAFMEMVELEGIRVYISCCQNLIAKYIATCPIMDLCLAS